ncbi:hypothetical protein VCV18_011534 [Metarhizium anisopliae]
MAQEATERERNLIINNAVKNQRSSEQVNAIASQLSLQQQTSPAPEAPIISGAVTSRLTTDLAFRPRLQIEQAQQARHGKSPTAEPSSPRHSQSGWKFLSYPIEVCAEGAEDSNFGIVGGGLLVGELVGCFGDVYGRLTFMQGRTGQRRGFIELLSFHNSSIAYPSEWRRRRLGQAATDW